MIFKHQDMIFKMCIYLKLRREILPSFLFIMLLLFLRHATLYFNEVNFCILGCLLEICIYQPLYQVLEEKAMLSTGQLSGPHIPARAAGLSQPQQGKQKPRSQVCVCARHLAAVLSAAHSSQDPAHTFPRETDLRCKCCLPHRFLLQKTW